MKYIVGLNLPLRDPCHESGVALLDENGRILYAASEERFSRKKLDGEFPEKSVESMFSFTHINPEDVSIVAIPSLQPVKKIFRFMEFMFRERFDRFLNPKTIISLGRIVKGRMKKPNIASDNKKTSASTEQERSVLKYYFEDFIKKYFPNAKIVWVEHHIAHAASAYYTSPWKDALIATFDGAGNMISSLIAKGENGKISVVAKSFIPHSLGSFWGSVTRICGFKSGTRHGGKVTGLAAYGNPEKLIDKMRQAIWAEGMQIKSKENLFFNPNILVPDWGSYEPERLKNFLGEATREDISAAAQLRLEEVAADVIKAARKNIPYGKVVLAGGVCANVKMNQRILELPEVEDIYIHPAMSDGGLALGSALFALAEQKESNGEKLMPKRFDIKYKRMDEPAKETAAFVHGGGVVGFYNGRMEYGPRALGNRSILYAPKDPEVNNWLNKRLNRSEFMPFAPVTLIEKIKENYLNIDSNPIAARYMTVTYNCTDRMKKDAPACVHIDGTARPQVISRDRNQYYYDIVSEYEKLSGIPTLINTSFNMHEEPIVCSPEDALRAFLDSGIDYLVMGPFVMRIEENKGKTI
jgi:carbamoyltransferase